MYQRHLLLAIYTLYISYLHSHLTSRVMYKILPSIFLLLSCEVIIQKIYWPLGLKLISWVCRAGNHPDIIYTHLKSILATSRISWLLTDASIGFSHLLPHSWISYRRSDDETNSEKTIEGKITVSYSDAHANSGKCSALGIWGRQKRENLTGQWADYGKDSWCDKTNSSCPIYKWPLFPLLICFKALALCQAHGYWFR